MNSILEAIAIEAGMRLYLGINDNTRRIDGHAGQRTIQSPEHPQNGKFSIVAVPVVLNAQIWTGSKFLDVCYSPIIDTLTIAGIMAQQ